MLRIGTIIALAIGALGCRSFHPGMTYWTAAEMEAMVRAEVPPGASREQVIEFLERHDLDQHTSRECLMGVTDHVRGWSNGHRRLHHTCVEFFFGDDNVMDRFATQDCHSGWLD